MSDRRVVRRLVWVAGEPIAYSPRTILPAGHPTVYYPARLRQVEIETGAGEENPWAEGKWEMPKVHGFTKAGRNPHIENVCVTCVFLRRDIGRSGGHCTHEQNQVVDAATRYKSTPFVMETGGCDLHKQAAQS